MISPEVDVIIAVHASTRPVDRAVASVVNHTKASVRVTVIAHNIDPTIIRDNLGSLANDPRVRILALSDGIPSPAGPLNLGLAEATAPFTSVMGSDDEFAPGAIDSWLRLQHRTGAAAVIARIFHVGRGNDPFPPVRIGHHARLNPDKDRLSYRSAPLGLVSRKHFGELRFTMGLASGEDLAYTSRVWFSGLPLAVDFSGPAYVGHSDAVDRVTAQPRSVSKDFSFLDEILGTEWFRALPLSHQRALCVKLIRLQVFDAILARSDPATLPQNERANLADVVTRILAAAPGTAGLLSRADRRTLDQVFASELSAEKTRALLDARWNYRSPAALLTANPWRVMHRQAPFRTLLAGLIVLKTAPKSAAGRRN